MAINGEWGILKKMPVSADCNQLIYDQAVLGMDHLDGARQTLSQRVLFKVKDVYGNVVHYIFYQLRDWGAIKLAEIQN